MPLAKESPAPPKRSPALLTVFAKPGCCLCDEAMPMVERTARHFHVALRKVSILDDPRLYDAYRFRIPVVVFGADGSVLDEGRLDERRLRAALRAALTHSDAPVAE